MNRYAYEAIIDGINDCSHESLQNKESKETFEETEELEDDEEENNEEDSEEETNEDEEGDSEQEEDEEKSEETRKNIRRRPETAFSQRRSKRFKASTKTQNRIQNLRHLQKLNAKIISESDLTENKSDQIDIKTAIDRIAPLDANLTKIESKESFQNEASLSDSDEEESDEEIAFARDVQTVKLNEPRKPLIEPVADQNEATKSSQTATPTKDESKDDSNGNSNFVESNIFQRKVKASSNETNLDNSSSSTRTHSASTSSSSEREKRIADQVKLMKQKQMI